MIKDSNILRQIATLVIIVALSNSGAWSDNTPPPVKHSTKGEHVEASGGALTITNIGKKQNFDWRDKTTVDEDIFSPKSAAIHPDGTKYYINSLEGCCTVVYDLASGRKIKVIRHRFDSGTGALWNTPSPYYHFTHYTNGEQRAFSGKPVESAFSHGGRYLWVPYYKRSFDINAQDPSAVAIIDTRSDSIVRMMEVGPLPKMVACSHDSKTMAVTHWGNNTVALIDISSDDPTQWHHLPPVAIGKELKLDFSLTQPVDRDKESGLKLRGTTFTPDDRYLLVGCMGGGGIGVIDMQDRSYQGLIEGISNARHLVADHGYLYASMNVSGMVMRIPLDSITAAITRHNGTNIKVNGWQSCKVGRGARTIELSPSGNFLFAACNSVSELDVVDTRSMSVIARITVDSYPVGLAISRDGSFLVTTSQGRQGHGGNAVNLYKITYADLQAEQVIAQPERQDADTDTIQTENATGSPSLQKIATRPWIFIIAAIALILIIGLAWARHRNS